MADFKIIIADPKTGKCAQREIKDQEADVLVGLKIRDKVKGEHMGLAGYEFEITGGSDHCGFPMRKDVSGQARKKILAVEGVGVKKKDDGIKQRKTVCGNTIHAKIAQVNLKTLTYGKENLFEGEKEEAPAKGEAKAETRKEQSSFVSQKPKVSVKPAEKKEEVKKPEQKPEPKQEEKKE